MNSTELPTFDADGPDIAYAKFIEAGKFKIQRCSSCDLHVFFPRMACPHCGAATLKWVEASGQGTVYSTSTPRGSKEGDYNISLIDLAEGPRMMSRVVDIEPEQVQIGMEVEAFIGEIDDQKLVLFKPRSTGSKEGGK